MGRPRMAGKHQNPTTQGGGRRRLRRPDPGVSGGGWPRNFTGKNASPCSSSLAGACARVVASDASHGQNSFGLQIGQNDPVQCSMFWGVFSRAFGAQNECVGARVLFGTQNYVYIGPRVSFR